MESKGFSSGYKIRPGTYVKTKRIAGILSKNPLKPPFWATVYEAYHFAYTLNGVYLLNGEIRMDARKG